VFADLAARGHALSPIEAQSPLAGQAGAIAIDEHGMATGAHDPRGEGLAIGISSGGVSYGLRLGATPSNAPKRDKANS
jgi:gamma-glutamyltranspeptidase/glutathione hydrolase